MTRLPKETLRNRSALIETRATSATLNYCRRRWSRMACASQAPTQVLTQRARESVPPSSPMSPGDSSATGRYCRPYRQASWYPIRLTVAARAFAATLNRRLNGPRFACRSQPRNSGGPVSCKDRPLLPRLAVNEKPFSFQPSKHGAARFQIVSTA